MSKNIQIMFPRLRFGLMLSKVALTVFLKNYKVTVNEKTKEPLELLPNTFILAVKGDIWLDVEKILILVKEK
jgi:cytochrome P450 family 6